MAEEANEVIAVTTVKGRRGEFDPGNCQVTVTVYADHVHVRMDSWVDYSFWTEFDIPLAGTPAAKT